MVEQVKGAGMAVKALVAAGKAPLVVVVIKAIQANTRGFVEVCSGIVLIAVDTKDRVK